MIIYCALGVLMYNIFLMNLQIQEKGYWMAGSPQKFYGQAKADFIDSFEWCQQNLPEDVVLITPRHNLAYFLSRQKVMRYPPKIWQSNFYVIEDEMHYKNHLVTSMMNDIGHSSFSLSIVHESSVGRIRVWKLDRRR